MPAIVAHHALGLSGRARGVEDVERVGGLDGHAVVGLGRVHGLLPVDIPAIDHRGLFHRALQDDAVVRFVRGEIDGLVQQRLVGDDPARLDTAGGGDDGLGSGVVDAHRQLIGGKAAEDHRVDGAEAGASQHGDRRLGHHGHVDDDAVALADPMRRQHAGELGDLVAQLSVGEGLDGVGDRAVVDQRRLVAAAVLDMQVEGVVAGVALGADEPAIEGLVAVVEDLVPLLVPVDCFRGLAPEPLGVRDGTLEDLVIAPRHRRLLA